MPPAGRFVPIHDYSVGGPRGSNGFPRWRARTRLQQDSALSTHILARGAHWHKMAMEKCGKLAPDPDAARRRSGRQITRYDPQSMSDAPPAVTSAVAVMPAWLNMYFSFGCRVFRTAEVTRCSEVVRGLTAIASISLLAEPSVVGELPLDLRGRIRSVANPHRSGANRS